ncbi:Zinc metalloproteinase nas-36 [Armadillidium vulgare]|nr:Zinc metalloproteinase nas-36 [Armadillidium vulgare]
MKIFKSFEIVNMHFYICDFLNIVIEISICLMVDSDYNLYFSSKIRCYSYIGRKGGGQEINLPTWCTNSFGSLLHEMYHALGFLHEQSRSDRDAFVDIK